MNKPEIIQQRLLGAYCLKGEFRLEALNQKTSETWEKQALGLVRSGGETKVALFPGRELLRIAKEFQTIRVNGTWLVREGRICGRD